MMVFSMPCFSVGRPDRHLGLRGVLRRIWAVLVLGCLLSWAQAAEVSALRAERVDDGIYLTVNLKLEIPPPVEDALLKGIALIFVAEAEIVRERWYWTDKRVALASRSMRLAYQPLTRRWRLSQGGNDTAAQAGRVTLAQHFGTLAEAVAALESMAGWRIAEAADLEASASHLLSFRFRLDAGQLPRPFQIGIAGQRDWQVLIEQRQPLRLSPPEARP